ncbi:hypothetical protein ABZ883_39565 [Streptomyces sp. NPDC046977]|uniref:hypothetical protein n=1 Tax=Streptomyces sp. NPDC046977 TaxID=3154703 RepID=UPI00340778D1
MTEMEGGDYQCDECLGTLIDRDWEDDPVVVENTSPTRPVGDPQEAPHRRAG